MKRHHCIIKIFYFVVVYIFLISNSFSQNHLLPSSEEFYDVFPLTKWNKYNYKYESSDTTLWLSTFESARNDSGTTSYLIIDSTFRDNKIEWLVERNINLLRHYIFSSRSDTTYWFQQKDNFILTEGSIGNHELSSGGSVGVWQFPAFLQIPVYRYSTNPSLQANIFYNDRNFDSLWFDEKRGLYYRRYHTSDVSYHSYFEKTKVELIGDILGIINDIPSTPEMFKLTQNYANPFNPSTKIIYSIPQQTVVKLTVYDVLGRIVTTLVNEEKASGNYEVEFNATALSNGIYLYRLQTDNYIETKKMILLK